MSVRTLHHTPTATAEVVTITPAMAEQWLMANQVNRKLRDGRVNLYRKQMQTGGWRLTGEPIIFLSTGALGNGQHRLSACVASGQPFRSVVVRGIDPEAMKFMDNVLKRTASDAFHMDGVPSATLTAATVKLLISVDGKFATNTTRTNLITQDELDAYYAAHTELIRQSIALGSKTYKTLGFSNAGWCAVAFLTLRSDWELANVFMEGLATGAGLEVGDSRLALRAFLLNLAAKKHTSLERVDLVANGVKAWNNWLDGSTVKLHKGWRKASGFPEVAA